MRNTQMSKKGNIYIISGPSGSGKSTVLKEVFAQRENYYFSISATTRSPRPGEQDGVEYFFITKERFQEMIENDEFLEYAQYVENS
jgi:guanylate kinase